jgi:hypothetical protein
MSELLFIYIMLAAVSVLLGWIFRFRARNLNDALAVVRRMEKGQLEALFDPQSEAQRRATLSKREFRNEQQILQRVAFEYVRRMAFNGIVILELAQNEKLKLLDRWKAQGKTFTGDDEETYRVTNDVIQAGIWLRVYLLGVLVKLGLRLALSALLPAPKVSGLRTVNEIDGPLIYELLLVRMFCLVLITQGPEQYEDLVHALGWPDPVEP